MAEGGDRAIAVVSAAANDGWECIVTVNDARGSTRHRVRVGRDILGRLSPGATEPDDLVRASFEFLLERESKESILGSFELPVIARYFPEYEREIRRRLGGAGSAPRV